ncbi:MAG: CHAT domain-containing protein [Acidobacteria bacterium]|nr:MAG: CHAT domain-containing protein [Acidobacteriota bacterium]REK06092.1 MAG: CHAT domain-containing protein [Acidobacteriota bacterium]
MLRFPTGIAVGAIMMSALGCFTSDRIATPDQARASIESSPLCVERRTRLSGRADVPRGGARQLSSSSTRREASRISSLVRLHPTTEVQLASLLCTGRWQEAVALSRAAPDGAVGDFRAIALLELGLSDEDRALDLLRGLEASEIAARAAPQSARALHNLAVALESFGLAESAIATWRRTADQLPAGAWRSEALANTERLQAEVNQVRARDALLDTTRFPIDESWRSALESAPDLAFRLFEEHVLGSWVARGERKQEEVAEAIARSLASRGDLSAAKIMEELRPRDDARRRAVALFQQATGIFRGERMVESAPLFAAAANQLESASPTLARRARLYAARCLLGSDRAHARDEFGALYEETPEDEPFFKGQAAWFAAIVEHSQRNEHEALRWARLAYPWIERGAGRRAAAFTHVIAAGPLEALGRHEESWRGRLEALREITPSDDHWQKHSLLLNTAFSLLRSGFPERALPFFDEQVRNAEHWEENATALAEVLIQRSKLHTQLGDRTTALEDVRRAREILEGVSGEHEWIALEAGIAEGLVHVVGQPRLALELLEPASRRQVALGELMELLPAQLGIAEAQAALGRSDASLRTLASLAAEIEDLANMATSISATDMKRIAFDVARVRRTTLRIAASAQLSAERMLEVANDAHVPYLVLPRAHGEDHLESWRLQGLLEPGDLVLHLTPLDEHTVLASALTSERLEQRRLAVDWRMPSEPQRAAERLWLTVESELASMIDASQHLHLVLHEAMARTPMHAARDASGRKLLERFRISIWPRLETLIAAAAPAQPPPPSSGAALTGAGTEVLQDLNLPELRFAVLEAESIAAIYPDGRMTSAASAADLDDTLAEAHVVHFAGHAVLAGTSPIDAALVVRPTDDLPSGLYSIDRLRRISPVGARVVVLAACETAVGMGLDSAPSWGMPAELLRAGAGFVLATLRPLEDREGLDFLVAFHRLVAAGQPATEAYRLAALEAVARGDRAWAAFQPIGGI